MVTAVSAPTTYRQARTVSPTDWWRVGGMVSVIAALHIIGFGIFFFFVVPQHYRGLGIGVSLTAYTLGLRHAFDADHISAIDNTTRKLMNDRRGKAGSKRPLSVGYYFSLGHSTIVIAIGAGIVIAEKAVYGALSNSSSGLEQFGGAFGTIVSATFLYLIALLNIVILTGIVKVFQAMRKGTYDEAELERQLQNRGLMYRFFGKWMRSITREWHMYPVGVVFGMGFDTATEVALLATTALLATQVLPWYSIMCLPILFTAGMSLMDTLDELLHERRLRLGLLQPRPQGLLQPGHHRSVRGDLLLHRNHRGLWPPAHGAAHPRSILELHGELQHQHRWLRDRGHVRPHLGRCPLHLEIRASRGEVERSTEAW